MACIYSRKLDSLSNVMFRQQKKTFTAAFYYFNVLGILVLEDRSPSEAMHQGICVWFAHVGYSHGALNNQKAHSYSFCAEPWKNRLTVEGCIARTLNKHTSCELWGLLELIATLTFVMNTCMQLLVYDSRKNHILLTSTVNPQLERKENFIGIIKIQAV